MMKRLWTIYSLFQDSHRFGTNIRQSMLDMLDLFQLDKKTKWLSSRWVEWTQEQEIYILPEVCTESDDGDLGLRGLS